MGHLSVELFLVLHPHVLGEGVVVKVELVAHDDVVGQDDVVADGHVRDTAAAAADVVIIAVDTTRVFHFILGCPEIYININI